MAERRNGRRRTGGKRADRGWVSSGRSTPRSIGLVQGWKRYSPPSSSSRGRRHPPPWYSVPSSSSLSASLGSLSKAPNASGARIHVYVTLRARICGMARGCYGDPPSARGWNAIGRRGASTDPHVCVNACMRASVFTCAFTSSRHCPRWFACVPRDCLWGNALSLVVCNLLGLASFHVDN